MGFCGLANDNYLFNNTVHLCTNSVHFRTVFFWSTQ